MMDKDVIPHVTSLFSRKFLVAILADPEGSIPLEMIPSEALILSSFFFRNGTAPFFLNVCLFKMLLNI